MSFPDTSIILILLCKSVERFFSLQIPSKPNVLLVIVSSLQTFLRLTLCPCVLRGRRFLFSFEGVNDNRPQTMADAWPSQMWKTTANSTEFQAIVGFRREGLTSPILQFWLDGWFPLIRGPFSCEISWALNDEIRNEILWLKSLYLNPSIPCTQAPERKEFPYSGGPVGMLPYLIFSSSWLAMTGVSLYKVSVFRRLYLEWGLWFSLEDLRNGFQSGGRDQVVFCFEFNTELRFLLPQFEDQVKLHLWLPLVFISSSAWNMQTLTSGFSIWYTDM